jgi:3-oxoadipate CoA-transferase alpha subunit
VTIDKRVSGLAEAVAGVRDGATVVISGFGEAGNPTELVHALIDQGATDLVVVNNNAGTGRLGLAKLLGAGRVRKVICSFPRSAQSVVFQELYQAGKVELEVVPQGTLAERIRAGGAGIGGFYTPTSAGTSLAEAKETRTIDGREFVLEYPIHADVALIKADRGDRWGNLTYNKAARNFAPAMCMAAQLTIVQVREFVDAGAMDAEHVITPGVFVDRIVEIADPISEAAALLADARS